MLKFEEPTRFIFSHSALREGWDNPNVFVICALKHSDNKITKRQEVGRGMRLCVNQNGVRQDDPATVHDINVLTVVAGESYKLRQPCQSEIFKALSERPLKADEDYFKGKEITTTAGKVKITPAMAKNIYRYLLKHDYTDGNDQLTQVYHDAVKSNDVADLPFDLQEFKPEILRLLSEIVTPSKLPEIGNNRAAKRDPLNSNFEKQEFKELWNRINHRAVYSVDFEGEELVRKNHRSPEQGLACGADYLLCGRGDPNR